MSAFQGLTSAELPTLPAGPPIRDLRPMSETRGYQRFLARPEIDPLRDDPRFQEVFDEILEYAGLEGAVLKRAPAED